jgi:hypothetical protein
MTWFYNELKPDNLAPGDPENTEGIGQDLD